MTINQLDLEGDLIRELQNNCQIVLVDEQVVLAESGKYMKVIPLVLDGLIRVFRNDYELGTTRVVISRILKDLENQGFIKLMRGEIQLEQRLTKYT